MISYKILKKLNISKTFLKLFKDNFDVKEMYTNNEVLKILKGNKIDVSYKNINWLMCSSARFQAKKILAYYKFLKPNHSDVNRLIQRCPYCQTEDMLNYYKALNPSYRDIKLLISQCTYCQTEEIKELLLKGIKK